MGRLGSWGRQPPGAQPETPSQSPLLTPQDGSGLGAVGLASWCQHFPVSSAFERRGCGPHVWGPGAKAYV